MEPITAEELETQAGLVDRGLVPDGWSALLLTRAASTIRRALQSADSPEYEKRVRNDLLSAVEMLRAGADGEDPTADICEVAEAHIGMLRRMLTDEEEKVVDLQGRVDEGEERETALQSALAEAEKRKVPEGCVIAHLVKSDDERQRDLHIHGYTEEDGTQRFIALYDEMEPPAFPTVYGELHQTPADAIRAAEEADHA